MNLGTQRHYAGHRPLCLLLFVPSKSLEERASSWLCNAACLQRCKANERGDWKRLPRWKTAFECAPFPKSTTSCVGCVMGHLFHFRNEQQRSSTARYYGVGSSISFSTIPHLLSCCSFLSSATCQSILALGTSSGKMLLINVLATKSMCSRTIVALSFQPCTSRSDHLCSSDADVQDPLKTQGLLSSRPHWQEGMWHAMQTSGVLD